MPEVKEGCVKPTQGPIIPAVKKDLPVERSEREAPMAMARVGKPAPDFELSALVGSGFKNIKLSDYKGKWIVICFYPGDFTFV
jgi:hypothetical protein